MKEVEEAAAETPDDFVQTADGKIKAASLLLKIRGFIAKVGDSSETESTFAY